MEKAYLSMLVENRSGVLARISGLIARRGFNIDSLTVCATEDDRYSRMTISLFGDDKTIRQIKSQLEKQTEVVKVLELEESSSVLRELLLIKISTTTNKLPEIVDLTAIYKAKVIDVTEGSITLELTGRAQKLKSFIDVLTPYGILELARSGASALERGEKRLKD